MKPSATIRRGFLFADAIIGLAILSLAMVVLVVSISRENLAEQRLADARQAVNLAEAALTDLQCGLPLPVSDAQQSVHIAPAPVRQSPRGCRWVCVTASVSGQTRQLIGLVPQHGDSVLQAHGVAK